MRHAPRLPSRPKRYPPAPAVDPYAPGSADYEARHTVNTTTTPCGVEIVSMGAPIK